MENPFKKIALPPQEVPEKLKSKVMADIARIKLFNDITELFSSNYPKAAKAFFDKKRKKD